MKRMKERLLVALGGDYALVTHGSKEVGYVAWDAQAPQGIAFQTHKYSIIDAFEVASTFLETNYAVEREWLLVGIVVRTVISTLPQMEMQYNDGIFNGPRWKGFTFYGKLGPRKIYFASGQQLRHDFLMFNDAGRFVRGHVVGANYSMGGRGEPHN